MIDAIERYRILGMGELPQMAATCPRCCPFRLIPVPRLEEDE